MIGIYKIENTINNNVYIGQSINIKDRITHHKSKLRKNNHENKHLQNAWNKYGENAFNFEIIEECEENILDEREIYWIKYYGGFESNNVYNGDTGGKSNKHFISSKRIKIDQYDLQGNYIKTWDSISEALKHLKVNSNSKISKCCNDSRLSAFGYQWKYTSDNKEMKPYNDKKSKIVYQYDKNKNFIRQWNSTREIKRELGYCVDKCCSGKRKTANGYIWSYEKIGV